jgi:general stress protein YciG
MDPDRQRELAAEGGRASHGGRNSADDNDYDEDMSDDRGRSNGNTSTSSGSRGRRGENSAHR